LIDFWIINVQWQIFDEHSREGAIIRAQCALIAKGDDIISNCAPTESLQIAEKIRKLKERTTDTNNRAAKRKVGVFLIVSMFKCKIFH
jgi:hypothetical protein